MTTQVIESGASRKVGYSDDSKHRVYGDHDLTWRGNAITIGKRKLAFVVRDTRFPEMWRVSIDGRISDMVNESRARDAAMSLALGVLNRPCDAQDTALGAPPVEQNDSEAA